MAGSWEPEVVGAGFGGPEVVAGVGGNEVVMGGGGFWGFDFAAVSPRLAMHLGRRKERIVPTCSSLTRSSGTVSTGFASETATRGFFARGAIVRGKRGGEAPRVPTQRPLTEIATLNLI